MSDWQHSLVLATTNAGKVREFRQLLTDLPLELKSLADFETSVDVIEDGEDFATNAAKKAREQAGHLNQWVLAEDSGLVVDSLDGAPGVYSARFSGEGATDESNNELLLKRLEGMPRDKRTAHYICSIAVADASGEIRAASEAGCHGRIVERLRGGHGFGYDPLFEIPEYHRTFGELGDAVKKALSHRARATIAIRPHLIRLFTSGSSTEVE